MVTTEGSDPPGNSAAEENLVRPPPRWVALMPGERRDVWRGAQVRLLAAAWTRAAHLEQDVVLDGIPLVDLVSGSNVEDDGTVVNHDRIAPDYSTNAYQSVDALLVATLAGTPPRRPPCTAWGRCTPPSRPTSTRRVRVRPARRHRLRPAADGDTLPTGSTTRRGATGARGRCCPTPCSTPRPRPRLRGPRTPHDAAAATRRHLGRRWRWQRSADGGRTSPPPSTPTSAARSTRRTWPPTSC